MMTFTAKNRYNYLFAEEDESIAPREVPKPEIAVVAPPATPPSLRSFNTAVSQPERSNDTSPTPAERWNVSDRSPRDQQPAQSHAMQTMSVQPRVMPEEVQMNTNISEKFGRKNMKKDRYLRPSESSFSNNASLVQQFHSNMIERYLKDQLDRQEDANPWLTAPEIPSSRELMDLDEAWTQTNEEGQVVIGGNTLKGPWVGTKDFSAKEHYLQCHWTMLREEAIQPLRTAISWMKAFPGASEDTNNGGSIGIYSKVSDPYQLSVPS